MRSMLVFSSLLVLAACVETSTAEDDATLVDGRWYSAEQVTAGADLYQANCSSCHGADGSATTEWRVPGPDGNYPPPPLNGTAHTWHHPLALLDRTLVNGGAEFGGVMPGFGETLGEAERLAVIAWFQSTWSDEIYGKWTEIDARSKK